MCREYLHKTEALRHNDALVTGSEPVIIPLRSHVGPHWDHHLSVQPVPEKFQRPHPPIDELALAEIKSAIVTKLTLGIGKEASRATKHDWYKAAALALRDRI